MAQNTTINLPAGAWTQITANDVTAARWINTGAATIWVQATTDTTAPTTTAAAIPYEPRQGERSSVLLSDLWAGLTGADRLWAYCDVVGQVSVSHA